MNIPVIPAGGSATMEIYLFSVLNFPVTEPPFSLTNNAWIDYFDQIGLDANLDNNSVSVETEVSIVPNGNG